MGSTLLLHLVLLIISAAESPHEAWERGRMEPPRVTSHVGPGSARVPSLLDPVPVLEKRIRSRIYEAFRLANLATGFFSKLRAFEGLDQVVE